MGRSVAANASAPYQQPDRRGQDTLSHIRFAELNSDLAAANHRGPASGPDPRWLSAGGSTRFSANRLLTRTLNSADTLTEYCSEEPNSFSGRRFNELAREVRSAALLWRRGLDLWLK
jgi:hypothetical protein